MDYNKDSEQISENFPIGLKYPERASEPTDDKLSDQKEYAKQIQMSPSAMMVYAGPMQMSPSAMMTYAGPGFNMAFNMSDNSEPSKVINDPKLPQEPDPDKKICSVCGEMNPKTAKFCAECGSALEGES